MSKLTVDINDKLHKKFKLYCLKHGFGMRNTIEVLIEREIKKAKSCKKK